MYYIVVNAPNRLVEHDYSNDCAIDGFMSVDNLLNVNNISLTSDCLGKPIWK